MIDIPSFDDIAVTGSAPPHVESVWLSMLDDVGNITDTMTLDGMKELYGKAA